MVKRTYVRFDLREEAMMALFDRAETQRDDGEDFLDHERLALDRFRCPQCGVPLELVEVRLPPEERRRDPDRVELIAACRRCEIGLSKEEWARRRSI